MIIQLLLDYPELISRVMSEADSLEIKIQNPSKFVSSETG